MMGNDVHKVIEIALGEVGYLEKASDRELYDKTANAGDRNYTKYGKEMHAIEPSIMDYPAPWCDAFVDWCFYQAYGIEEAKRLLGGGFDDYTVGSARLYQNMQAWHTGKPQIGDQIFFRNAVRIYHTGLVYDVDSAYVYTVEGNTGGGSGVIANGGGVWKKKYRLGDARLRGMDGRHGAGNGNGSESSSVHSFPADSRTILIRPCGIEEDRILVRQ
ncbi:MAG: CHAP domain-containing protein [Hungatella hathewayi]